MQDFLFDEFDLQVSVATISRALLRARWSRKAVKARAAERNHELCNMWIGRQATWRASQLVFLDESACNERTGDRKFGWAPIGRGCESLVLLRGLKGGVFYQHFQLMAI